MSESDKVGGDVGMRSNMAAQRAVSQARVGVEDSSMSGSLMMHSGPLQGAGA